MSKGTNGIATNGTTPKTTTGKDTATATPELSTVSVDKATGELQSQEQAENKNNPLPPIEARLKRLEELQELVEKRETVVEALENLNRFYVTPSGGCNLKLTDSKGMSFGIAHPIVIGEMVNMAKAKLQDELTKIENAFVFSI